ncbi:MAG: SGNH/GDSL hydrolase family protein, partial [Helicobacter sp.]|nr:SGNH/GDSL hydrolase family protein [Helicobacter sp.]
IYKPSLRPLLAQYFTKESVIALWLADDVESFHKQLFALASAHIANRPKAAESFALRQNMSRNSPQSVFAALHSASPKEVDCIPYPGFNIHVECDRELIDKDFYLIEPIEWESLRNRPKDIILIAMMGNSALRVPYLPVTDTIPRLLQKQLNGASQKIIVLNFGIAGYTIYEQMMFYTAIVALLRPEIVISMFGGTDWRTGTMNDTLLLKNFQMCYTPGFYEYSAKRLLQSSLPLFTELQIPNPEISDDDVNAAILTRLRQFNDIV